MPDRADRPQAERPKNHEVEYEDLKPRTPGPPRSATEPRGAEGSVKRARTATDPGSGEARDRPDPRSTTPQGRAGP
jgi:hypothetical protein